MIICGWISVSKVELMDVWATRKSGDSFLSVLPWPTSGKILKMLKIHPEYICTISRQMRGEMTKYIISARMAWPGCAVKPICQRKENCRLGHGLQGITEEELWEERNQILTQPEDIRALNLVEAVLKRKEHLCRWKWICTGEKPIEILKQIEL